MIKLRLKRLGRKKSPFYRVVVMDIRARRNGSPLAELGYYNPLSRELKLDKQEAQSWLSKGASMSPAVERLMKHAPDSGEVVVLERAKREKLSKKAQARKEAEAAAAAEAKAAPAVEEAPAAEEAPAEEATA